MTAAWQAERDKLNVAQALKGELEQARNEPEHAKREGNFYRAGELQYYRILEIERKLSEAEAQDDGLMVEEAVRPEQIAEVVERWTGIPTSKMLEGERREASQDGGGAWAPRGRPACRRGRGVQRRPGGRARAGLNDETAPRVRPSLPTGVGKTEPPRRWPNTSMTNTRWSASTCRNSWRSIRSPV